MKNGTVKIILDRAQEFDSRGRTITLGEVLDFYADAEEGKEGSALVSEETGEIDLSALVAKLVGGKYWRDLALSQDAARSKAKLAPSKVYRARLGDVAPEAQAKIEATREEAAKLAGITLAAPKAPKAPPVEPLAQAMAKVLAEPVKAPKAAKRNPTALPKRDPEVTKAIKAAKVKRHAPVAQPDPTPVEGGKVVTLDNGSSFKVESY